MGDIGPIKRIIEVLPEEDPAEVPAPDPAQAPKPSPSQPEREPAR